MTEEEVIARGEQLEEFLDAIDDANPTEGEAAFLASKWGVDMATELAKRIREGEIIPIGFSMSVSLLINDCMTGVNGMTGEPMPGTIARYDPAVYATFPMTAERLAEAAFGTEFGAQVIELNRQIRES